MTIPAYLDPAATLDQVRAEAARRLRELASGIGTGGMVLVRNIGTDEVVVDVGIVDELLAYATALDGKTLEEAGAEIA